MKTRSGVFGLTVVALILLTGCTQKLTYERWQTLTHQSTKGEVETVLGTPNQLRQTDRWMYHDDDRQVTVNLEFTGRNQISYSRWIDPKKGVHEFGKARIEDSDMLERSTSKTDIDR
jgi:hypothetical protein